jgi:(1->4)-alpha-D-glucan 1-alpha-D-glucosylmutase
VTPRRPPRSTYRLQVTADHALAEATEVLAYLVSLGVDWAYLSPMLQSTVGSEHGYDVTDHASTDIPRGGRAGLSDFADTAHRLGLGVLVDVVPNHVGIAAPHESVWWWDVLTYGRDSVHADAFDIDWVAGDGKILLPVLGENGDELQRLELVDGRLAYYDQRFPLAPGTGPDDPPGDPEQVHDRQHYRLISWRRGDAELNYRRFFTISTLAGIRVERPEVFAASHLEIGQWIESGWVDGLRIDHPDGLADPGGYLDDLARLTDGRYTVVEKILEPGEELPSAWACAGTTGYDALAALDRLFVDPAGETALDALDAELRGGPVRWSELIHGTKREMTDGPLRAEVLRLARLVLEGPETSDVDTVAAAIAEILANFAVYRSYLPLGADQLTAALDRAVARRPDLADVLRAVGRRLAEVGSPVSVRFQQTSGMVMAKAVEDTAFYRFTRLTSLTEVGADPSVFALSPNAFHEVQRRRSADWPQAMTALSTHDTKRGEDVRARISVLAECPYQWAATARALAARSPLPDGPLAQLVWQAALGSWPISRDRLQAYAVKAAREAGSSTTWTDPDRDFERALEALVDAMYDDPDSHDALIAAVDLVRHAGWSNSLSAKLIQLTAPGVPDVYQGSELWETSLVDPDNRRPVDYSVRRDLLARLDSGWRPPVDQTGAAKLLVTSRALRLRRDRPDLFTGYTPLSATGPAAAHLVAIDRGGAIGLATRLPHRLERSGGWAGTALDLPAGVWVDVLTGRPAVPAVGELLADYPVALLVRSP